MTAQLRHAQLRPRPAPWPSWPELRPARCCGSVCEFDLHEAVDVLQADAERAGLIDQLGQDRVQQIIADAFHSFRAHEVRQ